MLRSYGRAAAACLAAAVLIAYAPGTRSESCHQIRSAAGKLGIDLSRAFNDAGVDGILQFAQVRHDPLCVAVARTFFVQRFNCRIMVREHVYMPNDHPTVRNHTDSFSLSHRRDCIVCSSSVVDHPVDQSAAHIPQCAPDTSTAVVYTMKFT